TDEAEHGPIADTETRGELAIARQPELEVFGVDGVRNDGDLAFGYATRDEIGAQALADREHRLCAAHDPGFERARHPVAESAFAAGAVIDRGVLPERADFVDDGNAEATHRAQRRGA